jgi:hypothetical protein
VIIGEWSEAEYDFVQIGAIIGDAVGEAVKEKK